MAKPKDIPAVCLLAETPGYLSLDANAAKAALQLSSKLLNLTLDYTALEKQAKENSDAVRRAQNMSRGKLPHEPGKSDRDLSYVS
jgi:proteasome assembly chaperone (PAC2) family protein